MLLNKLYLEDTDRQPNSKVLKNSPKLYFPSFYSCLFTILTALFLIQKL